MARCIRRASAAAVSAASRPAADSVMVRSGHCFRASSTIFAAPLVRPVAPAARVGEPRMRSDQAGDGLGAVLGHVSPGRATRIAGLSEAEA